MKSRMKSKIKSRMKPKVKSKIKPNIKLIFYFAVANALILFLLGWGILAEQIAELRWQAPSLEMKERQLAIKEENYRTRGENAILLSYLQRERGYIIQPPGQVGALLTEIRAKLYQNGLQEQEFYASELGLHYIDGRIVAETVSTLVAGGSYTDILSFLEELSGHYRFIHLERLMISEEAHAYRLWLTFSIYEEQ